MQSLHSVTWQLWTRGHWNHLFSSVATAHGCISLLYQLFIHLLPPPAPAPDDILLREDPAGAASYVEAGERMKHTTFGLNLRRPFRICTFLWRSADQWGPSWAEGNPCLTDGGLHGGRLPAVLDAVRSRGDARVLWPSWSGSTYRQFNSLLVGKDQHGPQPCHICAAQPSGSTRVITFSNKVN